MALIETRNSLLLLAGVRRAYGEIQPTDEQQEQADQTATIVRFDWEPGNSTRYRLTYTIRLAQPDADDDRAGYRQRRPATLYSLTWHGAILADGRQLPPSVGLSLSWGQFADLKGPWFAAQMGIDPVDADGLLLLLEAAGHAVSYCNDDPNRTIPQPRTPVLVQEIEGVDNVDA
jgi:hypothetical protein